MHTGMPCKLSIFSRLIICGLAFGCMASTAISPTAVQPVQSPAGTDASDSVVRVTPEVRLRKLHLVRPDLIPYPVAFEVYC